MNPFNPFMRPAQNRANPMQVGGAYPSAYYPTQTNGFDFSSMMEMFMPIMMMAMMLGMVGGMFRSPSKPKPSEATSETEGAASTA